jgi:hypothetical protein
LFADIPAESKEIPKNSFLVRHSKGILADLANIVLKLRFAFENG